jgi:hypothetical protein
MAVFKAIILLLYQTLTRPKVLKDALAHWGPYQTLMRVWYSDPGGENTVSLPATIQIKKNHHTNRFCMVTPHTCSEQ